MIIVRAFIGLGIIIGGFIIYPYYIENVIEPIVALARSMNTDLNVLEEFYLNILPLAIFGMIIFFAIFNLLGKVGIRGGGRES